MGEWWTKFIGKLPNAGIFYPEERWLKISSYNGKKLWNYRFHRKYPKALIFIFHGMFSESNDTSHIAKFFYENGYAVFALDQEGHGRSQGNLGQIKSIEELVSDSEKYVLLTKEHYPEKTPIFLLGISMGGTIAAKISILQSDIINGILLFAPALGVREDFEPLAQKLIQCLSFLCGCFHLSKFDETLSSRNSFYIEYNEENPYSYTGKMQISTAAAVLTGLKMLQKELVKITVPVVIVQGGNDNIISPEESRKFVEECKSEDKEFWFYEEMYHDVLFEPEIEDIAVKALEWISCRLDSSDLLK